MRQTLQKPILRILFQALLVLLYIGLYRLFVWEEVAGLIELGFFIFGISIGTLMVIADDVWLASLYTEPTDIVRPLTRSILFVLLLIPIGVFVLTSTASVLAIGLFLGITSSLVSEMVMLYSEPQQISEKYLWQLQRSLSDLEVQRIVLGMVLFLVTFSFLFVW